MMIVVWILAGYTVGELLTIWFCAYRRKDDDPGMVLITVLFWPVAWIVLVETWLVAFGRYIKREIRKTI